MDEAKTLLSNIYSLGDWATWKVCLDQVEERPAILDEQD